MKSGVQGIESRCCTRLDQILDEKKHEKVRNVGRCMKENSDDIEGFSCNVEFRGGGNNTDFE